MESFSQLRALHHNQLTSLPESFRLRTAPQASELDQRELNSTTERLSQLTALHQDQLSSLPESLCLRKAVQSSELDRSACRAS